MCWVKEESAEFSLHVCQATNIKEGAVNYNFGWECHSAWHCALGTVSPPMKLLFFAGGLSKTFPK